MAAASLGTLAEQVPQFSPSFAGGNTVRSRPSRGGEGGGREKRRQFYWAFVVLPVRIELTTSPLPRGCSTTELRQRRPACENPAMQSGRGCGRSLPQGRKWRKRAPRPAQRPRRRSSPQRPFGVIPTHERSSEGRAEGEARTPPRRGAAGKPQAPQGASQRPFGCRGRAARGRTPRFRRNCRG